MKKLYEKKQAQLWQQFSSPLLLQQGAMGYHFAHFSSNVSRLLPQLPVGRHLSLFRRHLWYRAMAHYDQQHFATDFPLPIKGWPPIAQRLAMGPRLIGAFHLGSYRLINYLLASSGMAYALVVAGDVLLRQGNDFLETYGAYGQQHSRSMPPLPIIDASRPNALLHMARQLRGGRHLLLYLDGLEGRPKPQRRPLTLCGVPLHLGQGAAYLSAKLDVPLLPFLTWRNGGTIHCQSPWPLSGVDARDYLQSAFDHFGALLRQYPDQWASWCQLQEVLGPGEGKVWDECREVEMEPEQVALYRLQGRCYAMQKATYISYEIAERDFNELFERWYRDERPYKADFCYIGGT